MRRIPFLIIAACFICAIFWTVPHLRVAPAAAEGVPYLKTCELVKENGTAQPTLSVSRAAREEKALQDARRQQLTEKEAELAIKEQELKKLSSRLDVQLKSLEESKTRLDDGMKVKASAQKKLQDEKMQKMVKLFKAMRGEQAGKFIDGMQESLALTLLSRMDTKAVAKLTPFISQPRVLKWITDNLSE